MEDFDIEETNNKPGVLWTWGFDPSSYQPIYTAPSAAEMCQTAAMMPRWEPNTANSSIKRGVFKSRVLMDAHTHPPFPKQFKCLD